MATGQPPKRLDWSLEKVRYAVRNRNLVYWIRHGVPAYERVTECTGLELRGKDFALIQIGYREKRVHLSELRSRHMDALLEARGDLIDELHDKLDNGAPVNVVMGAARELLLFDTAYLLPARRRRSGDGR